MKEYLDKEKGYALVKDTVKRSEDWIEVLHGADTLTLADDNLMAWWINGKQYNFRTNEPTGQKLSFDKWKKIWNAEILWRREKTVEYLDTSDWSLKIVSENSLISGEWLRVPEGADSYVKSRNVTGFVRKNENGSIAIWVGNRWISGEIEDGDAVLWQRHTQPEELPFIDDEPEHKELDQLILENSEPVAIPESWLKDDAVNHPTHYTTHPSGIECIEITRHHDFAIGNAIKYLWRAGLKDSDNEVQDLKKAIWYIQDKINQLEKSNGGNN